MCTGSGLALAAPMQHSGASVKLEKRDTSAVLGPAVASNYHLLGQYSTVAQAIDLGPFAVS